MPRRFHSVALGLAIAAFGGALVSGQAPQTDAVQTSSADAVLESIGSDLWFVELSSPPTADGTSLATVQSEKAAFRSAAAAAGLQYQERRAFDTLFNGLSVRIDPGDVNTLRSINGVKAIYPVQQIAAPPEPEPGLAPELATAIVMTGADVVQSQLGFTGAGVKVGIIDTGVDYDHPDLGGCFGPGCRVFTGYDFVGDAYTAGLTPQPDDDPDDCYGHGTHVAGIVGANGGVKGVAPGVLFGAYRVFGCNGTTEDDVMIAAMERALADGMQVVNMSIGAARGWPEWPTAMAATRLVNSGVVVVAAAGNDRLIQGTTTPAGLYMSSAPATGSKVISAASFDNTHVRQPSFTVSPDNRAVGYTVGTPAPPPPVSGTFTLVKTGTTSSTADGCGSALPAGDYTGKVVLIRRGFCTFYEKANNAQTAGAAGVVLYNNTTGFVNPSVAGAVPITIPVVMITNTDGAELNNRIAAGPTTMTWTADLTSTPNPTGGLISSFSSYGVSPDLAMKPDIGAPGGSIYSTYPLEKGGYATMSGTSMATPHIAGAVALLLEAKPHTPAQAVRDILQNSAQPAPWSGNPGLGYLDQVHSQGAGLLKIDRAILATTAVRPGKLSLGESAAGPTTRTLTLTNAGSADVTYVLSHAPALATGPNTFTPSAYIAPAAVTFSASSVTVPAGGTASVDATIAPGNGLPDRGLYGGYLVFTPQGGGQSYRVPYAGFKGDYQSIQALTPTPYGFPWLAKVVGSSYENQSGGSAYTMAGSDIPFILFHLNHQVRRLRGEVFDVSGKSWHRALDEQYEARNTQAASFFAFGWSGQTVAGRNRYTVPNGQYVIKLSVLKALGDENNPADWETWTSPIITIARP